MQQLYNFVSGPLLWVAFSLFIGGSLYRIIRMFWMVQAKEKWIFSYMDWRYSLRSIFHWLTPFATVNMRKHPVMTLATFIFHFCLLVTPIFLLAHIVLVDESWNVRWVALPDEVADIMTLSVVGSCIFFLFRRLFLPEVQYVTSAADFVVLSIVAAPFITGYLACQQWLNYPIIMILHIICGEIMLVAIPFTRLAHMLFAPFTRAYMGSEFGAVRHVRDW